jgi:hypothetical protein
MDSHDTGADFRRSGPDEALEESGIRKMLGKLEDEYEMYKKGFNDGKGNDFTTGKPLKTFDEWLGS